MTRPTQKSSAARPSPSSAPKAPVARVKAKKKTPLKVSRRDVTRATVVPPIRLAGAGCAESLTSARNRNEAATVAAAPPR